MKAIVKAEPGIGAVFTDVPRPKAAKDEVLVKVHRASICGSDMAIYHWNSWAPVRFKTPSVFGHEFCGEIAAVGSSVRGLAHGDFVSVESHIFCGLCLQCRNGQRHVCRNLKIIGIDGPGGFAQYARVPARCAWKHSDRSLKDIGSLMEPLGNAIYATLVEEVVGKSVLVLGCGPQGLFAILAAKASGAGPVIAVEGVPYRSKLARKMGADFVFDPADPGLQEKVLAACAARRYTRDGSRSILAGARRKYAPGTMRKVALPAQGKENDVAARYARDGGRAAPTGGGEPSGADVVLEMSGNAQAIGFGLRCLRSGGRFSAFGIPSGALPVRWAEDIVFKGIRVFGIAGREIFQTWHVMERLLRSKAVDVRPTITHVFALKDFKKAFDLMASKERKCGKIVFQIS